jgi:uncharacterized membrane protein YqjE
MLDSLRTLLASSVALMHGRLELAGAELRREQARTLGLLLAALASLLLLALGIAFAAVTVMIAAWEQYRLAAAAALTVLFLSGGAVTAYRLRLAFVKAPRMFDASLSQLEKDHDLLDRVDAQRGQIVQQATQFLPKIALAERAFTVGQTIASALVVLGLVRQILRRAFGRRSSPE